jgi:HK97 family phage prohead protease
MQYLILPRRRRLTASGPLVRRLVAGPDEPRWFTTAGGACRIEAGEGRKLPSFRGTAYTGAVMRPGGWFGNVIIDLDGVKVPSQHRPILRQHDHEKVVGHSTSIRVDRKGIHAEGVLSGERHHVDSVVVPARNGFQWQLSVGANPTRTEFVEPGEETEVNGRTVTGPLTVSRETDLGEISFVPLGADQNTSVSIAAAAGGIDLASRMRQWDLDEINYWRSLCGRPPIGVAAAPVARTVEPLPTELRGVAFQFGRLNHQATAARADGSRGPITSVVWPGALTDALERLNSGRDRIALCVNHRQELCDTTNSGLKLRLNKSGNRLLFKLPVSTRDARLAATVIRANHLTGLSIALMPIECQEYPELPGYLGVRKAEIIELTATRTPCDPECRLRAV